MPYNIAYVHTDAYSCSQAHTEQYGQRQLLPSAWYEICTSELRSLLTVCRRSGESHVPAFQRKYIASILLNHSDTLQKLIDRGHKVIVITHAYAGRTGVRYLTNGLKVYYVPFLVIYRETTFPTVFSFFPIFRNIVIRERIEIVHGHASLSSLCNEAILHARTMGLRTVFTDHSLFGFADAGSILTNKLLKFTLSDVDHVICVSHTWYAFAARFFADHADSASKENTVLRASLDPLMVSVIPNAVVAENFRPLDRHSVEPTQRKPPGPPQPMGPDEIITVIVIQRLYYNKGTDLLVAAIPHILAAHSNVRFIIAGNGPKAIDLEQMIERNVLQDRVLMIGPVRHEEVRDVMVQGHIYLCPSLTEAFGTVIVEAASCGLYVVATRVGGIPEVLPTHMTEFAAPDENEIAEATGQAIAKLRAGTVRTELFHDQVKQMYSWQDVAQRTERVYDGITGAISHKEFYQAGGVAGVWGTTRGRAGVHSFALIERLKRYYGCGVWAGKLFCLCVVIDYLLYIVLEIFAPRSRIDICKDWPKKALSNTANDVKILSAPKEVSSAVKKKSLRQRRGRTEEREVT
jgi:phosphatidylinositol glycan class A protein